MGNFGCPNQYQQLHPAQAPFGCVASGVERLQSIMQSFYVKTSTVFVFTQIQAILSNLINWSRKGWKGSDFLLFYHAMNFNEVCVFLLNGSIDKLTRLTAHKDAERGFVSSCNTVLGHLCPADQFWKAKALSLRVRWLLYSIYWYRGQAQLLVPVPIRGTSKRNRNPRKQRCLQFARSDKFTALKEAFYRQTAPNITSLFATAPWPGSGTGRVGPCKEEWIQWNAAECAESSSLCSLGS